MFVTLHRGLSAIGGIVLLAAFPVGAAEQTYRLEEPVSDSRIRQVNTQLSVTGTITPTPQPGEKAKPLPLDVTAKITFRERRLSGAGRDARDFRATRYYDRINTNITVGGRKTAPALRRDRRLVVVSGRREGLERYCPAGPFTRDELDLLQTPGDALALLPLLPTTEVEVGTTWTPPGWAAQMLTDVEAATQTEVTCKLVSVKNDLAHVEFDGKVAGATLGAATNVTLNGSFDFDLNRKLISAAVITQAEARDSGPYNPKMDVTATQTLTRGVTSEVSPLSDALAKELPLEPSAYQLALIFTAPWNMRFFHGRDWHVFHQTSNLAVLRLVDETGAFVSQCTVAPIPSAKPGEHTSEQQFQADIRTSLGAQLKQIAKAELLDTQDGRFLYRVTAVGSANGRELTWFYYLCAAPSGRQVSFVFVADTKYLERLGNRDLEIVHSMRLTDAAQTATPAN